MSSGRAHRIGFFTLALVALVMGVWSARERVGAPPAAPAPDASNPSQSNVVAANSTIPKGPATGSATVSHQPLPSLLENARNQLPRKAEIARVIRADPRAAREVKHGPPRVIVEYAQILGDLAERYEQDPASREAIDDFYRECALLGDAPDSIRAVCYKHILAHRPPKTLQEAKALQVPSRVMEIARKLPKARPVR